MSRIPVVAIVGPTASGKSELGVRVARHCNGEIVSADSMQIYRGMPIASAVPNGELRSAVPHHLLEVLEPTRTCSVAEYCAMAHRVISDIHARGRLPVLVGGTGLYVDSVLQNRRFPDEPRDGRVREALLERASELGGEAMYRCLQKADPQAAEAIHPNNLKRVLRALEAYALTGQTLQERNASAARSGSPYDAVYIGLDFPDRSVLYGRINRRADDMLANGLLGEAEYYYHRRSMCPTAGAAIGHKEFYPYFAGDISLETAVAAFKQSTRRYAKRQMTWFRKNPAVRRVDGSDADHAYSAAIEIINETFKPIQEGNRPCIPWN